MRLYRVRPAARICCREQTTRSDLLIIAERAAEFLPKASQKALLGNFMIGDDWIGP